MRADDTIVGGPVPTLVTRPLHDSVESLLAGATRLGDFAPPEARSTTRFERVLVDGEPCIVKYLHRDDDFALRAMGDVGCVTRRTWETGLMDTAPEHIDHATIGVARWGRDDLGCALLMRDVSDELAAPGDEPLTEDEHDCFLRGIVALAARNWGFVDTFGLLPDPIRWQFFGPGPLEHEAELGFPEHVPRIALEGWERFATRVPDRVGRGIEELRRDASPIVDALADTPQTLLHGDWKLGNIGRGRDGRTVLIDWAYVGRGPIAHELAWYLALNRSRLPLGHTKESTIDDFVAALDDAGVDRGSWWSRQLGVCLLGALVQFGWEKALGDDVELAWWVERAEAGLAWL